MVQHLFIQCLWWLYRKDITTVNDENLLCLNLFIGFLLPSQTNGSFSVNKQGRRRGQSQAPEREPLPWAPHGLKHFTHLPQNLFQRSRKSNQEFYCFPAYDFTVGNLNFIKSKSQLFSTLNVIRISLIHNVFLKNLLWEKQNNSLPNFQIYNTLNSDSLLKIKIQIKY